MEAVENTVVTLYESGVLKTRKATLGLISTTLVNLTYSRGFLCSNYAYLLCCLIFLMKSDIFYDVPGHFFFK